MRRAATKSGFPAGAKTRPLPATPPIPNVNELTPCAAESVFLARLGRHSVAAFLVLLAIASLRVVSTYAVFSNTYDEPVHLACGMEWLTQGSYHYEPLHPPLARVAAAIGPWLDGRRSQGLGNVWAEGPAILAEEGRYDRTLFLSRLGELPFLWLACLVVYLWGRRCLGPAGAVLAVLLFSNLPPVLAHAGLATTDMALTATVGAAFLAALYWCERPTPWRALALGCATGLAVLSKFSSLTFLPVAFVAAGAVHLRWARPDAATLGRQLRLRLPTLCLAAVAAFYVVWAGYRFSFGHVPFTALRLPFPEFYIGLQQAWAHEKQGAPFAYLLGEHRDSGWWWYYFVVLGVKTPLALFGLCAAALLPHAAAGARGGPWAVRYALAFAAGIFVFCLFNHINLGVRHILPVYIGLSIVGAAGALRLIGMAAQWRPAVALAAALLLALLAPSAMAHPDYLPYFNLLAGSHPEKVLVDSDLDWGQDFKRLALRLRQMGVRQAAFTPCLPVDPATLGLPPLSPNDFIRPSPGWNVMRVTLLQLMLAQKAASHPELTYWPELIAPTQRVGAGLLLWYFPPDRLPATGAGSMTVSQC
jgi:hypothetical protein